MKIKNSKNKRVTIGDEIRSLRGLHNYTQEQFAILMGTKPSVISEIERGLKFISISDIDLICQSFNLSNSKKQQLLNLNSEALALKEIRDKIEMLDLSKLSTFRLNLLFIILDNIININTMPDRMVLNMIDVYQRRL